MVVAVERERVFTLRTLKDQKAAADEYARTHAPPLFHGERNETNE